MRCVTNFFFGGGGGGEEREEEEERGRKKGDKSKQNLASIVGFVFLSRLA